MVGGTIVGVSRLGCGDFRLNVEGTGCERNDTRTIIVRCNDCRMMASVGDSIWWQSGQAYWTHKTILGAVTKDEPLELVFHS